MFLPLLFFSTIDVSLAQTDQENHWNDFPLTVETIIILGGTVSVPIIVWALQTRKHKRDKVWELYRKFHSIEFLSVRNTVWDNVHKNWDKKVIGNELLKDQIIQAYLEEDASNYFKKNNNDYTKFKEYLNNISIILYFWTEIHINIEEGTTDKKLTVKVFLHMYTWWREFLKKFLTEYEKSIEKSMNPNALWIESISKLDKEFGIIKNTSKNELKMETENIGNSFSIILGVLMFLIIPILGYFIFSKLF